VVDQANETASEMRRRRPLHQRLASGLTRFLSSMRGRRSHQTSSRPLAMLVCGSLTLRHTDFCAALDGSPHVDVIRNRDVLSAGQRRRLKRRASEAAGTHLAGLWDDLHSELRRCELLGEVTRGGHDHVISILRDTFLQEHAPPNVEIAPLDSNLSSYMRRADCLVCSSSSFTILEVLAQGTPCILAPLRSAILEQCPFFHAMKTHSRVTDLENIVGEIDAVMNNGDEIPASWSEGVFYAEPAPGEVVEKLALKLNRQRVRGRAAA
jgi:hypothetical protein